ncbi:MAG: hypothetical protein OSB46_05490 [Alphaproteobacteria bacterium]|nr:hypothetical protein [Alphaproteobacteria bacterium]
MGAALYRFLGILGGTALNLVPIVRVVAFLRSLSCASRFLSLAAFSVG